MYGSTRDDVTNFSTDFKKLYTGCEEMKKTIWYVHRLAVTSQASALCRLLAAAREQTSQRTINALQRTVNGTDVFTTQRITGQPFPDARTTRKPLSHCLATTHRALRDRGPRSSMCGRFNRR